MFAQTAELYDKIYSFKDYAQEARVLARLVKQRNPAARTLLDVACGTGKHLEFLRKRFRADGVDILPEFCGLARRRNPGARIFRADMTALALPRRYDAVVCLFSSIGYVRTEPRLRRAVASTAAALAPQGVLVVEPWFTPARWKPGRVSGLLVDEPRLKVARLTASKSVAGESVLEMHYLMATGEGVKHLREVHRLGLFTSAQMRGAFRAAGLQVSYDRRGLTGRGLYIGWRR